MKKNHIYHQDCIIGMQDLEPKSIDLILADPPYNLSNESEIDNESIVNKEGGEWSKVNEDWDKWTFEEYVDFTKAWLEQVQRVIKPTGSIWIFGTYHNIGIVNYTLQSLRFNILNEIIWYKRNAIFNFGKRQFRASHENILWSHYNENEKREYYFDYNLSKSLHYDDDSLNIRGQQMRSVWDISNNKKKYEIKFGKHPTQKPMKIIERMLLLTSKPNDLILVPFAGSGSECVTALKHGRFFIGFETEQKYIDIADKRIAQQIKEKKVISLDKLLPHLRKS